MSVVHVIDTLTEWARQNICEQINLKVPPENTAPDDSGYSYNLATPAAFAMYVPTSDKLPPGSHPPFPSLCVRFVTGQDVPADGGGSVEVQFCFSAWDPGTHGEDEFLPNGDGDLPAGEGRRVLAKRRRLAGCVELRGHRPAGGGERDQYRRLHHRPCQAGQVRPTD